MQKQFHLNDKTVDSFFLEYVSDLKRTRTIYELLAEDVFLKKGCGIESETIVTVTINDSAKGSGVDLLNIYTFYAREYDSATIALIFKKIETKIK